MTRMILGLGSNLGDRLQHLRRGLAELRALPSITVKTISPVYLSDALLPDNAPADWNRPYFNLAISCETQLTPEELLPLLKKAEIHAGRLPEKPWGPRIIDIDLLAFDQCVIQSEKLKLPHPHLCDRPFALWPLADVAPDWFHPIKKETAATLVSSWGSRFSGDAPFHTRQIAQRIDTPELIGIINLTPDSFSDGALFTNIDQALTQAMSLVKHGATILDIGAEATNPNVKPISAETEWQRLGPFLTALLQQKMTFERTLLFPRISIDTRHPETAQRALALGVDWINDVSGLDNLSMQKIIAEHTCDIVMMHHLGIPANQAKTLDTNTDPLKTIYTWAENKIKNLEKIGIARQRIIFDPGIGFGKTAAQSFALIKNCDYFKSLELRLLVGHSRKRFFDLFTEKPFVERDIETAITSLAMSKKVDYLRVHHVDMTARVFRLAAACKIN